MDIRNKVFLLVFFVFFVFLVVILGRREEPPVPPTLKILTPPDLPGATVGESYSVKLRATDVGLPLSWAGTPPAGLTLHSSSGVISGTPGTAGTFSFDVTVTNRAAPPATDTKTFTLIVDGVVQPRIASISPARGDPVDTISVTINGSNFQNGATSNFGAGITVDATNFVSSTELTARITIADNAAAGTRTVTVSNPDTQSGRLTNGFEVGAVEPLPTTVTDVSPNKDDQGQSLTVTINGSGFQNGATANFGAGITVNATNFVSASRLSAAITIGGNAVVGPRTVTVSNPDGQTAQLANGFDVRRVIVLAPSVTTVSPANGEQGQSLTVTINGSNFQNGATSNFGAGVTVNTTNFVSASRLTAAITIAGNAVVGSRTVTVSNPDGQTAQLADGFDVRRVIVLAPSVTTVSPANGEQGQSLTVT
ncbi:MAG: IPT/TIG domain-containing protein, partial [Methylococcales bacterium]